MLLVWTRESCKSYSFKFETELSNLRRETNMASIQKHLYFSASFRPEARDEGEGVDATEWDDGLFSPNHQSGSVCTCDLSPCCYLLGLQLKACLGASLLSWRKFMKQSQ